MKLSWTAGRAVAAAVSVALMVCAVSFGLQSRRQSLAFDQWQRDIPLAETIDLSKAQISEFPYRQTCSSAHFTEISLKLPQGHEPETQSALETTLLGFSATISILDANGNVISRAQAEPYIYSGPLETRLVLFRLYNFPKGSYRANLTVASPALALATVPHSLEADYILCSLEKMPAHISAAMSVLCGIVVILIVFSAWRRLILCPRSVGSHTRRHDPE